MTKKLVLLISGRGSNLQSILRACQTGGIPDTEIAAVISNRVEAPGLIVAQAASIPTEVTDHRAFPSRAGFDTALQQQIDRYAPDLVVLAGFMRQLTDTFVEHYPGRLVNIHPSLLPAFPGLHTHARAIAQGVCWHGASVHFVIPELDAGPVIIQAAVPVHKDDDPARLAARVLAAEHEIYPQALSAVLSGWCSLEEGRVRWSKPAPSCADTAINPVFTGPSSP
ncbi:phosphoribosylglycinamide formyltransferase [Acidithiobacillus sulfurivorans]|uniref:Phosphoribosylglycinamide formyltransferase n=1 Tax=Acidithiobacillus sulfurivorans TaxID=1958756 RepID=A0ABS5ZX81_9PROT|nr:phosphoribosylglycinamide formyltransferase [Acidithiobacillus sulfurivorans]MBU2759774.1 phosphoribosylglycinamide formyltransferase [Acidithiobacillus sulfurivorans]